MRLILLAERSAANDVTMTGSTDWPMMSDTEAVGEVSRRVTCNGIEYLTCRPSNYKQLDEI